MKTIEQLKQQAQIFFDSIILPQCPKCQSITKLHIISIERINPDNLECDDIVGIGMVECVDDVMDECKNKNREVYFKLMRDDKISEELTKQLHEKLKENKRVYDRHVNN